MAKKAEEVKASIEADLAAAAEMQPGNEVSDKPEVTTDADLWGDFSKDFDSDEEEITSIEGEQNLAEEEVPAEPVTPAEEPPAVPVKEKAKAEAKVVSPATPPATPEPVKVEEPPATPAKVESPPATEAPVVKTQQELENERQATAEARKQEREKALDVLAGVYKLSEEEADQFVTNPGEVVPKFAARLFFDVFDAVVANLQGVLPQVVQNVQHVQQAEVQAEDSFYSANPMLDKAQHKAVVDRYAMAYVQVNPGAKAEDIIRDVGIQVMYALGIDPNSGQQQQQPPPKEEIALPAHTPAGATRRTTPVAAVSANVWGNIADELADDEG